VLEQRSTIGEAFASRVALLNKNALMCAMSAPSPSRDRKRHGRPPAASSATAAESSTQSDPAGRPTMGLPHQATRAR